MRLMPFMVVLSLAAAVAALSVAAAGDEPSSAASGEAPETFRLTVAPAPEPRPALKYRLLPAPSERTPGNAAPYYYRAMIQLQSLPKQHWKQYDEHREAWLT